jgi:hypothetical protein
MKTVPEKGFFYLKKFLFCVIIIVQHSTSKGGRYGLLSQAGKKEKRDIFTDV